MPENINILDYVIAVLLASAGGLARLLNAKDVRKLKWRIIFAEIFVSGFAGLMILLLARNFALSGDWIGVFCGMAGWMGPRILDAIAKMSESKMGIDGSSSGSKKE